MHLLTARGHRTSAPRIFKKPAFYGSKLILVVVTPRYPRRILAPLGAGGGGDTVFGRPGAGDERR